MTSPADGMTGAALRCWYDGEPAREVWRTTSAPGQSYPMCGGCSSRVRRGLSLRAAGRHWEADRADRESGIDTSGVCGKWIDPAPQ